jgi:small subunit ribosomal protein S3e
MESGAKGAEVSVSGKVRGQRAKTQKFSDGYMIKTGHAYDEYVETAVRHVLMKQGVLGVKVAIMLPYDPKGEIGPKTLLSDTITILEPKNENNFNY